jgi:hypothetical protein
MISIFYTGERRFEDVSRENHELLINEMKQRYGDVSVYYFTQPEHDRSGCPYQGTEHYRSGGIQMWDFLTAAEKIDSEIIIKFRTDAWFASSSFYSLFDVIDKIKSRQYDIAYMGAELFDGYDKHNQQIDVSKVEKIQDFIIAARKSSLANKETAAKNYTNKKAIKSGNKVFYFLMDKNTKGVTVRCQIYLIRKIPDVLTDGEVAWGFIERYYLAGKNIGPAVEWYKQNRHLDKIKGKR